MRVSTNPSQLQRTQTPTLLIAVGLLLASAAVAAETATPQDISRMVEEGRAVARIVDSAAALAGDHDTAADELLEIALASPTSPVAELALRRLGQTWREVGEPLRLENSLSGLREAAGTNGYVAEVARALLGRAAFTRGDDAAARRLAAEYGAIGGWVEIKPFGEGRAGDFHRPFAPEFDDDPTLVHQSKGKPRRWEAVIQRDQRRPPVAFGSGHGRNLGYSRAVIELSAPLDALLHIETRAGFKLWIDGREALVSDAFLSRRLDEQYLPVALSAGRHVIMVKAPASNGLTMRLLDENGMPLVVASQDAAQPTVETGDWQQGTLTNERDALAYFGRLVGLEVEDEESRSAQGYLRIAHGYLAMLHGDTDLALDQVQQGVLQAGNSPGGAMVLGRMLLDTDLRPEAIAENEARAMFEMVGEIDPRAVTASIQLASMALEEDRHEDAIRLLDAALVRMPESAPVQLELADLYDDKGWHEEARELLLALREARPNDLRVARRLEEVEEDRDNYEAVIALLRARLDAQPGDASASRDLAAALELRGEREEARALVETELARRPADSGMRLAMVSFLMRGDEHEAALAIVDELIAEDEEEADLRERRGDLLMLQGRREEAVVAYREALRLDMSRSDLRDYLAYLTRTESDVFTAYMKTLDQLEEVPTAEDYPEASSVLVLDEAVVVVYPDGSSVTDVYSCKKVLTSEGVGSVASAQYGGELITARTHQPDGSVLEPIRVGRGGFEMPGVDVGSIVELRYRTAGRGIDGRFPEYTWYFQDTGFEQPFHLSRLVLIVPSSMTDLRIEETAFEGTHEVVEEGANKVHTWEVRGAPRLIREWRMPGSEEILPNVRIESPGDWEEILSSGRDMAGAARTSISVRRKAEEICAGETDPIECARRLYEFVNEHVKQDSYANPAVTLEAGQGSRSLLFLAMARSAGLDVRTVEVGPNPLVDLPVQFDYPQDVFSMSSLLAVMVDDRPTYLDFGSRFLPFGRLSGGMGGSMALVHGETSSEMTTLPELDDDLVLGVHEAIITIGADEVASIEGSFVWDGMRGALIKQQIESLESDTRRLMVANILGQFYPGFSLDSFDLPGLVDLGKPMTIEFAGKSRQMLAKSGDGFAMPTGFATLAMQRGLLRESDRKFDYISDARVAGKSSVTIRLPEGASFSFLPRSVSLMSALGFYRLECRPAGVGVVRMERQVRLLPGRVRPEAYSDFVDFCVQVDRVDQERLQLRLGQ